MEFGIRLALGEPPASVRARIVRQAARLALAGGTAGVVGALLASRLLGTLLFGILPTDPQTYAVVFSVVVVASMLASWIPARRAGRVNPNDVLKANSR